MTCGQVFGTDVFIVYTYYILCVQQYLRWESKYHFGDWKKKQLWFIIIIHFKALASGFGAERIANKLFYYLYWKDVQILSCFYVCFLHFSYYYFFCFKQALLYQQKKIFFLRILIFYIMRFSYSRLVHIIICLNTNIWIYIGCIMPILKMNSWNISTQNEILTILSILSFCVRQCVFFSASSDRTIRFAWNFTALIRLV